MRTILIALVVGIVAFVSCGDGAPSQGGVPMDPVVRGTYGVPNSFSYFKSSKGFAKALSHDNLKLHKKAHKRGIRTLYSQRAPETTSAGYLETYDATIKLGPHSDNQLTTTPHLFINTNNEESVSCQIDCQSVINIGPASSQSAQGAAIYQTPSYYGCSTRYYSYGSPRSIGCTTPQTASDAQIELARNLCNKVCKCYEVVARGLSVHIGGGGGSGDSTPGGNVVADFTSAQGANAASDGTIGAISSPTTTTTQSPNNKVTFRKLNVGPAIYY